MLCRYALAAACGFDHSMKCPYTATTNYNEVIKSDPDIITIMLGSNDAAPFNWNKERFVADYVRLACTLARLPSSPKIFLVTPPPMCRGTKCSNIY